MNTEAITQYDPANPPRSELRVFLDDLWSHGEYCLHDLEHKRDRIEKMLCGAEKLTASADTLQSVLRSMFLEAASLVVQMEQDYQAARATFQAMVTPRGHVMISEDQFLILERASEKLEYYDGPLPLAPRETEALWVAVSRIVRDVEAQRAAASEAAT